MVRPHRGGKRQAEQQRPRQGTHTSRHGRLPSPRPCPTRLRRPLGSCARPGPRGGTAHQAQARGRQPRYAARSPAAPERCYPHQPASRPQAGRYRPQGVARLGRLTPARAGAMAEVSAVAPAPTGAKKSGQGACQTIPSAVAMMIRGGTGLSLSFRFRSSSEGIPAPTTTPAHAWPALSATPRPAPSLPPS